MNPALELRGISKVYGAGPNEFTALGDMDLVVESGELVAVMGPSGSGKSTLLTIAGGLELPSSGQVLVHGRDLSAMSRDERATLRRRSVGYVFQELNLLATLTAAENVALPLELDGMSTRAARAAALAALDKVGVADKAGRFPDDLSGGERQRVAIARAIVAATGAAGRSGERAEAGADNGRRLLLADEPTGALDSVNGEAVMVILRKACRDGAAGVIVTHDAQLAAWADRIVFLRDGRVIDTTGPAAGPASLTTAAR